jgi:hypothetical protein
MWSQSELNRRSPACKAGAFPTKLWPRKIGTGLIYAFGIHLERYVGDAKCLLHKKKVIRMFHARTNLTRTVRNAVYESLVTPCPDDQKVCHFILSGQGLTVSVTRTVNSQVVRSVLAARVFAELILFNEHRNVRQREN